MFLQIKRLGPLYRAWYYLERVAKEAFFDCHMCGQCVLRSTAMTCPNQCPKQLRNGPCGGSMNGMCEVFPERRCIWTQIYQRADRMAWMKKKLAVVQPAMDWSLFGTSAWLNIWPAKKIDGSGRSFAPHAAPSGTRWVLAEPEAGACGNGKSDCACGAKTH